MSALDNKPTVLLNLKLVQHLSRVLSFLNFRPRLFSHLTRLYTLFQFALPQTPQGNTEEYYILACF